jgi:hypothetical protein
VLTFENEAGMIEYLIQKGVEVESQGIRVVICRGTRKTRNWVFDDKVEEGYWVRCYWKAAEQYNGWPLNAVFFKNLRCMLKEMSLAGNIYDIVVSETTIDNDPYTCNGGDE